MNKGISLQVPLWFDIGARIGSNFMAGAFLQYGFGILGSKFDQMCRGGVECSTHVIRVGPEFLYHIQPFEKVDPWVGVGLGYEWWTVTASGGGQSISFTPRGFEFLNLQAGFDFGLGRPGLGVGPFMSFSLGQYDRVSTNCSGPGTCIFAPGDVPDKSLHEWLVFGARLTAVL
jgi:hypothetical protein